MNAWCNLCKPVKKQQDSRDRNFYWRHLMHDETRNTGRNSDFTVTSLLKLCRQEWIFMMRNLADSAAGTFVGLNVVDVLKVGLSGLALLLAYLGYRLLQRTATAKVSAPVLRTIKLYLGGVVALPIIVGVFGIVETLQHEHQRKINDSDASCRDSLTRLDTQSKLPNVTADDLKNVIDGHVIRCQPILEKTDGK
jgi:hypothetical protein